MGIQTGWSEEAIREIEAEEKAMTGQTGLTPEGRKYLEEIERQEKEKKKEKRFWHQMMKKIKGLI